MTDDQAAPNTSHPLQTAKRISLVFLLLTVLLALFIHPVHDPDFWWHLKTGEWVWQHRSIPESDPFSFTTDENIRPAQQTRVNYLLAQYWLAQPLFYLAWKWFGPHGVIILRAGILLLSVLVGFRYLRKSGVSIELATALSMTAGLHLTVFTNERPQLWSFLFAVLYLYELEGMKGGAKRGIITLPVICIAWANMHSSALMAWIPAVCFLTDALNDLLRKQGDRQGRILTITAIIISLSLTFASPNTYHVFSVLGEMSASAHVRYNAEFISPIERFRDEGHAYPAYWALMILSGIMIFSRHMTNTRRLLLISVMLLSLGSIRFTPFFVLMAPSLVGRALQMSLESRNRKLATAPLAIVVLLAVSVLHQYRGDLFTWGVNNDDYPVKAVRFLKENDVNGRMLNFIEWGGYLMWHLPEKKTFTDGRVLRLDVWDEYMATAINPKPTWGHVLDKYRIGFVLLPIASPATGQPSGLIYLLLNSAEWKALYMDDLSVIFARADTSGPGLDKDLVVKQIISALRGWADRDPHNATRWSRIATAFFHMGDRNAALQYFRKAQELEPANPYFTRMVNLLGGGSAESK